MNDEQQLPRHCKTCGYLGVRKLEDQKLLSPNESHRDTGAAPSNAYQRVHVDSKPICGVGAYALPSELTEGEKGGFLRVIEKDRECKEHTPVSYTHLTLPTKRIV